MPGSTLAFSHDSQIIAKLPPDSASMMPRSDNSYAADPEIEAFPRKNGRSPVRLYSISDRDRTSWKPG
jgi:hypothetical protein